MKYRLILGFALFSLSSFVQLDDDKEHYEFTHNERFHIDVPTPGLFDQGQRYITVDLNELNKSGWVFPVPDGRLFTPTFIHNTSAWYILSEKKALVCAAMDGIVRLSRKTPVGRTVVIRHDNGLETVYGNNAKNLVKVGDYVRSGDPIALSGKDGATSYTYFMVMVNGSVIRPDLLFQNDRKTFRPQVMVCENVDGQIHLSFHEKGTVMECMPRFNWSNGADPEIIDLNRPFSNFETQHVAVPTPGLFESSSSFTLDLSQISDWSYPLIGAKVISPYGRSRRSHSGTDLKTFPKDKIRAAFSGVVRFSGRYSAYGKMIVIRHANGLETCYSHNAKNLVKVGDKVKAGDVIALVGRTGRASTEHCHFEVRVNGMAFDSGILFDHAAGCLRSGKVTFKKSGKQVLIDVE